MNALFTIWLWKWRIDRLSFPQKTAHGSCHCRLKRWCIAFLSTLPRKARQTNSAKFTFRIKVYWCHLTAFQPQRDKSAKWVYGWYVWMSSSCLPRELLMHPPPHSEQLILISIGINVYWCYCLVLCPQNTVTPSSFGCRGPSCSPWCTFLCANATSSGQRLFCLVCSAQCKCVLHCRKYFHWLFFPCASLSGGCQWGSAG